MDIRTIKISAAIAAPALCILLCMGCRQQPASGSKVTATPKPSVYQGITGEWMRLVNTATDSLSRLYSPEAVHIDAGGQVVTGAAAVAGRIHEQLYTIDSIATRSEISATPDTAYIYELGSFYTSDNKIFKHLLIRDSRNGANLRELEFIAPAKKGIPVPAAIQERREQWIQLCNAHNPSVLVEKLYAVNAIYYNHRPVIKGREDIIADYQYMADPNYILTLEPLVLEAVTNDLVFEIGQCTGTYNGKYILVWKKNTEGIWEVLLDSNI